MDVFDGWMPADVLTDADGSMDAMDAVDAMDAMDAMDGWWMPHFIRSMENLHVISSRSVKGCL
jgi:hypothetical protein